MLNEGLIVNDTKALVKSAIVNQIRELGSTTPDGLERAVFKSLVGHEREEVDWDIEDNQAGYFTWLKSFDGSAKKSSSTFSLPPNRAKLTMRIS